jgi:hypothetical protein
MPAKIITAAQQRFAAQVFNIASIVSVVFFPLIMLWIAASIFTYAAIAHHPNHDVREYVRYAGYRFYGLVGALVLILNYTEQMKQWIPGAFRLGSLAIPMIWPYIWLVSVLVIVPMGIRDVLRASNADWQDMHVENEHV